MVALRSGARALQEEFYHQKWFRNETGGAILAVALVALLETGLFCAQKGFFGDFLEVLGKSVRFLIKSITF